MCTNPNTTATNPDNFNEKEAVFEQAHTWARNVNSSIWLITSFFIGLNLVVIKTVLSNSDNSQVKDFLECLTCGQRGFLAILIFTTLWLIPALCALIMMIVSENLYFFLKSTDPFTSEHLCRALKWTEPIVSTEPNSSLSTFRTLILKTRKIFDISIRVLSTIRFPLGLVIAMFTIFFGVAWWWIFFYSFC